jgi:hypothetical protein
MDTYGKNDIERFLLAIDHELDRPFRVTIIGGTAAALAYQLIDYTRDIDTAGSISPIEDAYERAKKKTGLNIPFGPASVFDAPYDYEKRLCCHKISGLRSLTIHVPERHDLVLMKIVRADARDLVAAQQMHRVEPLLMENFIHLMDQEMTHITGNKHRTLNNFLALIELLYGAVMAKKTRIRLKDWEKK